VAGVPAPVRSRVGDLCLQRLCRSFCEKCPPFTAPTLPVELDDLSLACLLLAVEWGNRSPESTTAALESCLDTVSDRFWGDKLVWQLALEFCRYNPKGINGTGTLTVNLGHRDSRIRLWMFELAWCVRAKLKPVVVSRLLLKNVANSLGHWDAALGLSRGLYATDEEFWAAAGAFRPTGFAEQYDERVALARARGWRLFQQRFEARELRAHRLIEQVALMLAAKEMK